MSEMQLTSMMGMMMMVPVQSTATVSITANIDDYSAMVMNIDQWVSTTEAQLNYHKFAMNIDLTTLYGETLLNFATSRGWTYIKYYNTLSQWNSDSTNWLWYVDANDIANELNSSGYTP